MLSKIAFSILIFVQFCLGQNQLSLIGESVNPIESLFGSGYICLHISDPQFESSPSFQALARELAKKYNRTPIVHKIGSNETDFPHPHGPETIHYGVDPTTTLRPPPASLTKENPLPPCTREGLFPHPKNCTKFYRCIQPMAEGKPWQTVEFDCGPGTIFDEKIGNCNHPAAVNPKPACYDEEFDEGMKGLRGQRKRSTTTPRPDVQEVYNRPDEDPIPQQPDESQQRPDGQIPQLPDEVHGHGDGHPPGEPIDEGEIDRFQEENLCETPGVFGDKNNCSHYYQCVREEGGKFNMAWRYCPKGQIFDPAEEECRRPQEVHPKPECWDKVKHKKKVTQTVNEFTEITEDHEAPPPEESRESIEHFDEFESSGTTQVVVSPGRKHVKKTVVNTTEEIEEGPESKTPSKQVKGKKTRITIPRPIGPKPIPQCFEEGIFHHPTECDKYTKCVKKGKSLKLYFFPCLPAGTVFDQGTKKCVAPELIQPIPPVPDCVEWDDTHRPIFEDLLNQEVDEDEDHGGQKKQDEDYVPIQEEFEEIWVEDGNGGKKLVKKRRVTSTVTEEIEEIPGEKEPSQDLGGKKRVTKIKEKGHHAGTTEKPIHTVTIVNKTTVTEIVEEGVDSPEPSPDYGPPVEEVTHRTPPTEPEPEPHQELVIHLHPEEEQRIPCEDEAALVERLKRENMECEKRVAELEKQNGKMESQIKRMQKDLGIAKKDKQKYENYIASMDKTIDSYKEEVAWYLQHCPQPTEFIEDEENTKTRKRRRRSAVGPRGIPEDSDRFRERFKLDDGDDRAEVDSPRRSRKSQEVKPGSVHLTSEGVDSYDDSFLTDPFPSYDENTEEEEMSQSHHQNHKHRPHHQTTNHERSSTPGRLGHPRGHSSHWSPESFHDGKFLLAEIPTLIFGTLTILLITITLLGCLVVRRLNRMTTFSVSPEEFNSPSFRRKFGSGRLAGSLSAASAEKLGQV